jgi:uncharacterized protein (TIGR03437 family)
MKPMLRLFTRLSVNPIYAAIFLIVGCLGAAAQTTCQANAIAIPVHPEAYAERMPDITITCAGGTAGATVSLSMFLTMNTNITNRIDGSGTPLGVTVSGLGVSSVSFRLSSATTLNVNSLTYTVPAPSSTPVVITVSGIRVAVAPITSGGAGSVYFTMVGIGATFPPNIQVLLGTAATNSLLSSYLNNGVPCNGSPLPTTLDFATFASTSTSSTLRVTEGWAGALVAADPGADSGVRIRLSISGYGTGTRIFVPDLIAGNSASQPTSSGSFASTVGGGTYTPGANQLLLIRVASPDSTGAGGGLFGSKPAAVTNLTTVSEIPLTSGAATVYYEVADSNKGAVESFQIPVFVVVPQTNCPSTLLPQLSATLAPVSTVATATQNDPVPRFAAVAAASDCSTIGDCNAPYYPKLTVDTTPISLTGSSLGVQQSANIRVGNTGSGVLNFTTSIAYTNGSGWLSVNPPSGANNLTLQVIADPTALQQGTYGAVITVNAGAYGSATVPVTFNVGPVGVVVQNVGNAFSFTYGTIVPGSYAVIFGLNLKGKAAPSVTFNSIPGTVAYYDSNQINVIAPTTLTGQLAASVVVTVDGVASNPFKVNLAANAPGLYPVLVNFDDGSLNSASHPVAAGHFVLAFLTGFTEPIVLPVTVNVGTLTGLVPAYAGTGGLPGLEQVNFQVPTTLSSGVSPVPFQVCIPGTVGQLVCSNSANLYVH